MLNLEKTMSLSAQYDDLCRFTAILKDDLETDFIRFIQNQEACRKKWLAAERELSRSQTVGGKVESEMKSLETKLVHSRNLAMAEMNRRKVAEADKASLQRQISVIREMLTDQNLVNDQTREKFAMLETTSTWNNNLSPVKPVLNTINETPESLIDSALIDFDESNDCLEEKRYSLRSHPKRSSDVVKEKEMSKRRKSDENSANNSLITTTTITVPQSGPIHAITRVEANNNNYNNKPSHSEPDHTPVSEANKVGNVDSGHHEYHGIINTKVLPPSYNVNQFTPTGRSTTPMKTFSSAGKLNKRSHIFCQKLIIYPEVCGPCGQKINFYKNAMKCEDCRLTCHPECKDKAPLPCIPVTSVQSGKGPGVIADYTPLSPPMIPSLIVHCVNEVEKRGLNEIGIYRLSGSEKEIKDLRTKFKQGKGCPNLAKEDIHVVCSLIKFFLRTLKESLIPLSLRKEFVQAAETSDDQDAMTAMYQALSELPQPNRDTLAFLILHLQKVSECTACKMTTKNLAVIFGPTIVGYTDSQSMEKMVRENVSQQAVILLLLKVPSDYWATFINVEQDNMYSRTPGTPEYKRTPHASMLGPITNSGQKGKNQGSLSNRAKNIFGRTPLSSRHGGGRSAKKSQYFSSPMLK